MPVELDGRRRLYGCNGWLAHRLGCSIRTIQRAKRHLERAGRLVRSGRRGKADCYVVDPDVTLSVRCTPKRTSDRYCGARRPARLILSGLARVLDPYRPPARLGLPRRVWEAFEAWHEQAIGPLALGRGKVLARLVGRVWSSARWLLGLDAEDRVVDAVGRVACGGGWFGTCEDAVGRVARLLAAGIRAEQPAPLEVLGRDARLEQLRRQCAMIKARRLAWA